MKVTNRKQEGQGKDSDKHNVVFLAEGDQDNQILSEEVG